MTDPNVLELKEGIGIEKCPNCGNKTFNVHKDHHYVVDLEKETTEEPQVCEDPTSEITEITCAKCGERVSTEQDVVIFKSAISEALKRRGIENPTEKQVLEFVENVESGIPHMLDLIERPKSE